jgi:hypothetical protein
MKKPVDSLISSLLIVSLFLAGACRLRAAELPPASSQPASTASTPANNTSPAMPATVAHYQGRILGTSTFHDWDMKGTSIGGFVEFPAGVNFDTNQAALPGLSNGILPATNWATIPVRGIHSQVSVGADIMDGLMQDAMKQADHPAIQYKVTELKLVQPHAAGQPFTFDAKGDLAIAGVTNSVSFPVTITPLDKTRIQISGTAKLKMTDYKVQPPAPSIAGLGVMKCGDEVTIIFDWILLLRQQ